MKKIIIAVIAFLFILGGLFLINKDKQTNLTKVKVAEVTHSIFYAPQYLAHSLGYFKEEGFYINASAGEGLGLDVGFFLTAELGRYKGKKGDGINSLTGFSNYVSGGADCVTIEYNQSFDKRYSSVEFGLSIGTKSLPMVSGSAGFTNTWNLFRTDVFNEKK